ncbi:MAG: DUF2523 domain-containing protein [Polaromonas sp.]|nr:DUF2523 domain-containing protein [Polaromonas sp.]
MPIFLAALGGVLLNIAGSMVLRVLVSLGVGFVAYTGINSTFDWLKNQIVSSASGLPPEIIGMLSVMKVGSSISIIFSAIMVRLLFQGMTGETVKRWVTK